MLTDDVCPVKIMNGEILALPGYPQSKLCEDSLEKLKVDYEHLKFIRKEVNKRAVPIHKDFLNKSTPVKALYVLTNSNVDELDMETLEGADKFRVLKNNTYRHHLVNGLGLQANHFMISSRLATKIPIKVITKPRNLNSIDQVIDLIEKDLKS